ncbi:tyrosine-protein phosphatase [Zoogloea sp. LCSB751]|uniref:tyrosine-protein phosphatase n=1 Tax=Zoogloea sp. LCSB751 TaxID=1965277 RepID=UPI0020B1422E|nr:tyrosine-protein phosphatase [Zoogloea sp. LCSB751]
MDISSRSGRVRAWFDMHLVDHGMIRAVYNNFYHLGGGMYRCSQPSPAQLAKYQQKYGIRSVVNLRGPHGYGSYALEKEACDKLGLMLHDVKLYSRTAPEVEEVHAMDELFKSMEFPALLHCKSGADRAGLGSALYRILHLGHRVEDALAELNWRYGHFKGAKTGILDFFLASYVARNARAPIGFLEWVDTEYNREALEASFHEEGWSSLIVDKVLHRE